MGLHLPRRVLMGSLITVSLSAVATPGRAAAQDNRNAPADMDDDDNGFDKGLLGLGGTGGLSLGLRRRDHTDLERTGRV